MDWTIVSLSAIGRSSSSIRREPFNSGEPELDKYLKQYALKNEIINKTFVALPSDNPKVIAGYYTCCMSQINPTGLSQSEQKRFPRYPIPVMLIGKLAIDKSFQKMGLGKKLLKHAFESAITTSDKIGVYAIRVDALHEKAKEYYKKYGFLELQDAPLTLILPLSTIKKAIQIKEKS